MTPLMMGGAYGAGAYFFIRAFRSREWHPLSAGFPAIAAFAALMLMATLLHWDRLNHGDAPGVAAVSFYVWVVVYIVSPAVVAGVWWRNRVTDPRRPTGARVPDAVRWIAASVGAGACVLAAVFLVAPNSGVDVWPWQLTPLTARVTGCFIAEAGLITLFLAADSRWSAWRVLVQTFMIGSLLVFIGALRAWGDLDHDNPLSWLFVCGLATTPIVLALLYRRMERAGRLPAAPPGGVA